jgi:Predicted phosphohydrolases
VIQQVLNRDFVLSCMAQVAGYIEQSTKVGERRGEETDLSQLSAIERTEILEALRDAQRSESVDSSGQKSYDAGAQRRGESLPAMDDVSFFSRSPVVSNIQSAIEAHVDKVQSGRVIEESRRRGGDGNDLPTTNRRLVGPFEPGDIRWISALAAMGISLFRHKIPFPDRPIEEAPLRIKKNARLILVGDWGTGLPRAQNISNEIGKILKAGAKDGLEQHVIHLGDVYYSGWKREYQKHFLQWWPVDDQSFQQIRSWTLNGNHDMYSGGHDYFGVALADPRFNRWQQGKSYFAMENENWRVFGLDSAYEDFDLYDRQHDWVKRHVSSAGNQKLLFLTHHQPFSAYEPGNHPLEGTVSRLLAGREITAWFWGHEHRCVLYHANAGTKFGRCIGHGGVPVYMLHGAGDKVPEPGVYEFRERFGPGVEPWARFGFAVLDFAAEAIETRYIDETGEVYRTETIA